MCPRFLPNSDAARKSVVQGMPNRIHPKQELGDPWSPPMAGLCSLGCLYSVTGADRCTYSTCSDKWPPGELVFRYRPNVPCSVITSSLSRRTSTLRIQGAIRSLASGFQGHPRVIPGSCCSGSASPSMEMGWVSVPRDDRAWLPTGLVS